MPKYSMPAIRTVKCEDVKHETLMSKYAAWQASLTCRAASLHFSLLGLGRAVGIRLAEVWQVVLLVNLSLQVRQTPI